MKGLIDRYAEDKTPHVEVGRHIQTDQDVNDLLQKLLSYVGSDGLSQDDASAEDILLAVEIAGVRYKLIRCQPPVAPTRAGLSPREQEIIRLIAKGLPNKTIAAVLDISPWTVATHLRRVFMKLGVSSCAEMIASVLENGRLDAAHDRV